MLTLRDRRNRLSTESVESVECLHNWLLSGLIEEVLSQVDVEDFMKTDVIEQGQVDDVAE